MIADHETNVVYVADTLEKKFPDVYRGLASILGGHAIPLRTIPGTHAVWCRDYMPIQVARDRFVQFRYAPDYLGGRYKSLRADGEIGPTLTFTTNCERTEIVLDGGNVVKWSDKVILTEKIFSENPLWGRKELVAELERLLEVERLIFVPSEPGDVTGHSDGVVRFMDGGSVVMNDYGRIDRGYGRNLLRRLRGAGMDVLKIAYQPGPGSSEGMPSAVGNYINFLQVGSVVVVPTYNLPEDELVQATLEMAYPGSTIIGLACRDLAKCGGVLNCTTWPVTLYLDRGGTADTCI